MNSIRQWFSRRSLPELVTLTLLLFALVLPVTWFEPGHIIFRGDPVFPLDPIRYFYESLSAWNGKINLGAESNFAAGSIIHRFLQALPMFFGLSLQQAEIVNFALWFALPGIFLALYLRLLSQQLKISQWAVPIGVAYYLFNLYRLELFSDNNHLVVYGALPLALYLLTLLYAGRRNLWLYASVFALSSLLVAQASTNPPMYVVYWLGVLLYGAVLAIVNPKLWKKTVAFWTVSLVLTFLLNLYWIVPYATIIARQTGLTAAGNLNWLADLSKHTSLAHVIRLIGAWAWFDGWNGQPYAPFALIYQTKLWQWLTLIPFLLALLGLCFKQSWHRYSIAFLSLGLIGLIFSQGTHPPFGALFQAALDHIPFFWIFRSPWYKFTNLTALSFAVLIALGLGYILTRVSQWRSGSLVSTALALLAIAIPLVLTHPFLTGSRWQLERTPYPTHIRAGATWLNVQAGNEAVALLPYQAAAVYTWGYSSLLDPLEYLSRRPLFVRGDRIGYVHGETPGASVAYRVFVERLYSDDPIAAEIAQLLGIRYILLRHDINTDYYNDTDTASFIRERLSHLPSARVVRSFHSALGQWDIYELPVKENLIYATSEVAYIEGHPIDHLHTLLSQRKADSSAFPAYLFTRPLKQPNLAESQSIPNRLKPMPAPELTVVKTKSGYRVSGRGMSPFLLVLNQSYQPHWQASAAGAKVGFPVIANGFAPAWLVEPEGEFTISVRYRLNTLFVPLAAVSGLTLVSLLILISRLLFSRESVNVKP